MRAWAEINLGKLRHNIEYLRSILPSDCKIMAAVKADAYGHGAVRVSQELNKIGVNDFAVATIDEGIELRKNEIEGGILILGYTEPERVGELVKYHLRQTIVDYEYAKKLNDRRMKVEVELKIDTGMHRLGIDEKETDKIERMFDLPYLNVRGMFTHLCVADSLAPDDVAFTKNQIQKFYALVERLKKDGIEIPKLHIQSSYGVFNYPELHCDYARIGIGLFGTLSDIHDTTKLALDLQPVMEIKSRVTSVRIVPKDEEAGYGRAFHSNIDTRIATVSIGYGDGIPRNLSCGKYEVLICGKRVPIVGRICMDQMLVDVTAIPCVQAGDVVTLIGRDGEEKVSALQMAEASGTITNEIFSRLGNRIQKVYV